VRQIVDVTVEHKPVGIVRSVERSHTTEYRQGGDSESEKFMVPAQLSNPDEPPARRFAPTAQSLLQWDWQD
jgi:hypothetical protein